jgi:hypothetical protein
MFLLSLCIVVFGFTIGHYTNEWVGFVLLFVAAFGLTMGGFFTLAALISRSSNPSSGMLGVMLVGILLLGSSSLLLVSTYVGQHVNFSVSQR